MGKRNQKISTIIFGFIFVASTVLGCALLLKSSSMTHGQHTTTIAACCASDILSGTTHNIPLILIDNIIFQLFLLALVSLHLFIKNNNSAREYNLKSYFKMRDRYGGFALLNYFISLFRQGILHPKIY